MAQGAGKRRSECEFGYGHPAWSFQASQKHTASSVPTNGADRSKHHPAAINGEREITTKTSHLIMMTQVIVAYTPADFLCQMTSHSSAESHSSNDMVNNYTWLVFWVKIPQKIYNYTGSFFPPPYAPVSYTHLTLPTTCGV